MGMKAVMAIIDGRKVDPDIELIKQLLVEHSSWNRTRLSIELCRRWHWQGPNGQLKDMACRHLLLKLERAGLIVLPKRQRRSTNGFRNSCIQHIPHQTENICCELKTMVPLQISCVAPRTENDALFNCLLSRYHYLGHKNTVGRNMKYLVRSHDGQPLACALFGAAAWKTAARDSFIGWEAHDRETRLNFITNNTRFLVLPWVKVPLLASHVLSRLSNRVSQDWIRKYGHPIYLLETFIDRSRYRGICYRAANWIRVGKTKGRTRNDRDCTVKAPVKDVYLYPLIKNFRRELCYDHS